ncbi:hypothetical protein WJX81_005036 [Elliptochloris bilobata]|uniref:HECT-type E3 ubiquitin transferase n=1 Tax=Elliptochloris bilobata TaxID=381761 RepID=A0AAW1RFH2_9CHLO
MFQKAIRRGGKTVREATRAELLSKVKAERTARSGERLRTRAVVTVQRIYRGVRERQRFEDALVKAWLQASGVVAADPGAQLSAQTLADEALPPVLYLLLRPGSAARRQAWQGGHVIPKPSARIAPVLRGALALVLRSMAAANPHSSYCAFASDPARREAWLRQAELLLLLCASLLGSGCEALVAAAAVRLLTVLTDAAAWKCYPPGHAVAAAAAKHLAAFAGRSPALAAAARRLVAAELLATVAKDGREVRYLQRAPLLDTPGFADEVVATAAALLSAARRSTRPADSAAANAAGALSALWPLAEGTLLSQLLAAARGDEALARLVALLHLALEALPELSAAAGLPPAAGAEAAGRLASTLALGTGLLPRLWAWLARRVGLPLEAPRDATRGWDIAALRSGASGLAPADAAGLGLVARVLTQALPAFDDEDFHEGRVPLPLAALRGVATALNTLVYHTQCAAGGVSAPDAQGAGTPRDAQGSAESGRMLRRWAPAALRALYERDLRRRFCPPAMWLAPFEAEQAASAASAASAEERFSAAAVVRTLSPPSDGAGPAPRPLGCERGGGRPAALAALLSEAPQCVPFGLRVEVFRALVAAERARGRWGAPPADGGAPPLQVTLRRNALLEDAYAALRDVGGSIRGRLVVTFVNEAGLEEAGLDHGGLVKAFLEEAVREGFAADRGLFAGAGAGGLAYPRPEAAALGGEGTGLLRLLGLLLGKALWEGILLGAPLAPFFVARLQGRRPLLDDLAALDPQLHKSLTALKRYDGDVADLCLDFTAEDEAFGARRLTELLPGGADTPVTDANRLLYVHLAADWHLNGRLGAAAGAFASGLHQVIPAAWLRLFSPDEVNQLLAGGVGGGGLDLADMRAHTVYSGGFSAASVTVRLFWKVVEGMTAEQRGLLLRFVTSVSRAPLGGFRHMNPPLTIHKVYCEASPFAAMGARDVDRLPSASTCFNLLKLPNYRRADTLRSKLLYAISANAGFELS